MTPDLRILCTNDFLSSLSPMRTSYGRLPGGEALQREVARLRLGQPTIWADAGDFSQGGPLSTSGVDGLNFSAAAQLGIDVATVGNHEFDWGLAHLAMHRQQIPFPLICANLDIGLPATTLLTTAAGPVGFIGLTHPQLSAFTPHAPPLDADLERIVPPLARHLRGQGAVAVVLLIHFGVNWSVAADGAHVPDPSPVLELCQPFAHSLDAVVLGHTLGRWAAVIDGLPYAQPWAFGAELGVIDLDLRGKSHRVELLAVEGDRDGEGEGASWAGSGRAEIERAERGVIGHLERPLRIDCLGEVSLADFAAEALRVAAASTGAVVPVVGMHQPAIEGVMYQWHGPVTEADLSRFWPWTDDGCLVAECSPQELDAVLDFTAPEPWLGWGTARGEARPDRGTTIAVPCDYVDWATVQIGQLLGRDLTWHASDVRLRDAIRRALGTGRRGGA